MLAVCATAMNILAKKLNKINDLANRTKRLTKMYSFAIILL